MLHQGGFLTNYELKGAPLKIHVYPAPVLSKVAVPVTQFDSQLEELCRNMLFTMYNAPGIGLAAPQVGISQRIFVMDIDFEREEVTLADETTEYRYSDFNPKIFINPVIKLIEGEILYEEGCLSVPGYYEEVKRIERIQVDYQDLTGAKHSMDADGLLSVCIQHENDHLDGVVFIDRLSSLKRDLIKKKIMKEKKRKQL